MKLKIWIRTSAVFLAGLVAIGACWAQQGSSYPDRPVRLIVPYSTGGATDILARFVASKLADTWKQPVIVENRAGATGAIATEYVAKSAPDGYTLLVGTSSSHTVAPAVVPHGRFDNVKDFAPISMLTDSPSGLLLNPEVPANSIPELIALLKANPGKYNFSSAGTGSAPHMSAELFKQLSGTSMNHVPYKGDAPALADLVAGHVQVSFISLSSAMQFVRTGKLRAIGVGSPQRLASLPNVPAVAEVVPGFQASSFVGLLAPAQTPAPVVQKIHDELVRIIRSDEAQALTDSLGMIRIAGSPQEFAAFIRADSERWRNVVKLGGIKLE